MKKFKNIKAIRPPKRLPIEEVLPTIEKTLRTRVFRGRVNINRWNTVDLVNYWALRYIGAKLIPLVEGNYSLEELGFYDLEEYGKLSVAKTPMDLVLAGKPTPVTRVNIPGVNVAIWAKLEWFNPYSLSIKDRTAWSLVADALQADMLQKHKGLVEVSSSNTGLALAAIAAALGLRVKIYIPGYAPEEAENALRILGADVIRMDASTTTTIRQEIEEDVKRDKLLMLDQFNNDANFEVHLSYTAREYYLQLKSINVTPTVLVLASGTSGTASATAFLFKNLHPQTRIYIVEPARGEIIEGIRRIETGAKWLQLANIPYKLVEVTRQDALEAICRTARSNGILPGPSSGAVTSAIIKLYKKGEITGEDVVATIYSDTLLKYNKTLRETVEKCRRMEE